MGQRKMRAWILLLYVIASCVLVTCYNERSRREVDGSDDSEAEGEGAVEQYISAREDVEFELEEFYKTAPAGLSPDMDSDAMQELSIAREELMKIGMPPKELADLLHGDPGLSALRPAGSS